MSGPEAPVVEAPAEPEGLLKTLFVVIVLAAIGSTAIAFIGRAIQRADSNGLALELIPEEAELPFGLVRAGGVAVANDQRWVRYARQPGERLDPEGRPEPQVVLFGRYGAVLAVTRQFRLDGMARDERIDERRGEWEEDPSQTFEAFLEKGTTPVGPGFQFETDFLKFRSYREDGTFEDTIRVNLTTTREAGQLLVATWPANQEGAAIETLEPMLELLQLGLESETP